MVAESAGRGTPRPSLARQGMHLGYGGHVPRSVPQSRRNQRREHKASASGAYGSLLLSRSPFAQRSLPWDQLMNRIDRPRRPTTVHDLLPELQKVLGERLTAVIATGTWLPAESTAMRSWLWLNRESEDRLRSALSIATLLLEEEQQETVQAWFVGKNPMLGDRAPAIVLAEDPEKVRRAARDLVAHG